MGAGRTSYTHTLDAVGEVAAAYDTAATARTPNSIGARGHFWVVELSTVLYRYDVNTVIIVLS